jgi:hypothetical protein
MTNTTSRRRGRPAVYADAHLVFKGVALHPQQAGRIHDAARRRGVTFTAMLRDIVEEWVRENFPCEDGP